MKLLVAVLVLAVLHVCLAGVVGSASEGGVVVLRNGVPILEPVLTPEPQSPTDKPSAQSVAVQVDSLIRTRYWYYLVAAHLSYVAHIDTDNTYLFLHLYRNYIGTFLAITNYNCLNNTANINTLVRLGDGIKTEDELFDQVLVTPFVISVNLGDGEYLVSQESSTPTGNYNFTKPYANDQAAKNAKRRQQEIHLRCQKVESYIREQYWYYLVGAVTLDLSESSGISNCYCIFHFVNRIGTWQVISQWNEAKQKAEVNNFVRLGDGSDPRNITKCKLYPAPSET